MVLERTEFRGSARYELKSMLGAGGMGVVYEAVDRELRTPIALKYLPSTSPEAFFRFKREFRSQQDIHHENLVRFGELVYDGAQLFFTMELVDGVDIVAYCSHRGRSQTPNKTEPLAADSDEPTLDGDEPAGVAVREPRAHAIVDEIRVRRAFHQLVRGLMALHAAHQVHRDVKPGNVLVTSEGRVVLLDFGITADLLDDTRHAESSLIGSVAYMAPEQAVGGRISVATDFYAVGAILFEVLTQHLPFEGAAASIVARKQRERAPSVAALAPTSPADLSDLCARLLDPDPDLRPSGAEILQTLESTLSPVAVQPSHLPPPFIGRQTELLRLERALTEAMLGRVRVVHIEGVSGTGKTTLVRRFTEQSRAQAGVVVLNGRCSVREHVPYKAIDGIVDALVEFTLRSRKSGRDSAALLLTPELLRAFPGLGRLLPSGAKRAPQLDAPDPYVSRVRLLLAFRALFIRACADHALVLVVDDAQWADADSVALLASLISPAPAIPLLLLTVGQPSFERSLRKALDGEFLELRNLAPAESALLAESLLGRASQGEEAPDLAQRIAEEAAGHPLFIEALVAEAVRAHGQVTAVANLDSALSLHLNQLRLGPKLVVQLAALAAHPMPLRVLVAAAATAFGGDFPAFLELQPLYNEHLLKFDGTAGSNLVEPYHERVAVAVRSSLPDDERCRLHRAIATALEGEPVKDAGELALHWSRGGDKRRAARYALSAAVVAEQTLAFERAARLYEMALEDWPDQPGVSHVFEKLGDALANAGLGAPSARAYIAASGDSSEERGLELLRRAADQLFRSGHVDEAEPLMQRVFAPMGVSVPRSAFWSLVLLLFRRAYLYFLGLRAPVVESGPANPRDLAQLNACWSVAVGLSMVNNIRGACLQTRHLILALKVGQPFPLLRALSAEAGYTAVAGHRAKRRVAQLLSRANALAASLGEPQGDAFNILMQATCHFLMGDWSQSLSFATAAERIFTTRPAGAMWELTSARTFSLWSNFYLGNFSAMRQSVEEFIPEAEARGDRYAATLYRTGLLAVAWLAVDEPSLARARIVEAEVGWSRANFDFQKYLNTLGHCLIDLYEGDPEHAHHRITGIWPALTSSLYLRIQNIRIEASYFRGVAAIRAAADSTRSAALLRDAQRCAAWLEREKTPSAMVLAALLRAGLADVRGQSDSLAQWQNAAAAATAHGMKRFADAATFRCLYGSDSQSSVSALRELRARLSAQKVRSPDRLCALLAPGLPLRPLNRSKSQS